MVRSGPRSKSRLDRILLSCFGVLVLLGWFNIYAAGYNPNQPNIFDLDMNYGKQFIWIVTALVLGSAIMLLDLNVFNRYSYEAYGVVLLLLVAVLIFGKEVNGAKSWFGVGSFGIQPSEFAKVATALAVAKYLSALNIRLQDFRTRVTTVLLLLIPAGLIVLQRDTGTALVFLGFLLVMYREGLSGNILLIFLLAGVLSVVALLARDSTVRLVFTDFHVPGKMVLVMVLLALGALIFFFIRRFSFPRFRKSSYTLLIIGVVLSVGFILTVDYLFENVLDDHQRSRVNVLLGMEEDPQGAGWNVKQSKTAIGSGGLTGKGFLKGPLTKYGYVPMQSTDFIFCTIGEEWGFLGSLFVISLYLLLLGRLIFVAERQRSNFTRIYCYSVASIFFTHMLINIGMTVGLAPVIGIPLPFLSYGGSSLWAFTILLFIAIKLDSERLDVLR